MNKHIAPTTQVATASRLGQTAVAFESATAATGDCWAAAGDDNAEKRMPPLQKQQAAFSSWCAQYVKPPCCSYVEHVCTPPPDQAAGSGASVHGKDVVEGTGSGVDVADVVEGTGSGVEEGNGSGTPPPQKQQAAFSSA